MARHSPYVWPGSIADRLRFERGARAEFPSVSGRPVQAGRWGFIYTAVVQVPFYEPRRVAIQFNRHGTTPYVHADGPGDSPHRYGDNTLCMWYPEDPDENRWVFADGLRDLLHTTVAHLWREAWWRESGEWLGGEVVHVSTGRESA